MSPAQRLRSQSPPRRTLFSSAHSGRHLLRSTSPTSAASLGAQKHVTKDVYVESVSSEPAHYTLDAGPSDVPGTRAFYKSWAFRKKVNAGNNQVPGKNVEHSDGDNDKTDTDYKKKSKRTDSAKSFMLIFSRTNVRRANTQRKVDERMQRANRRSKLMRKLEGTRRFLDWD